LTASFAQISCARAVRTGNYWKMTAHRRVSWRDGTMPLLACLVALPACGNTDVNATSRMDGGAGTRSSGGASNGGSSSGGSSSGGSSNGGTSIGGDTAGAGAGGHAGSGSGGGAGNGKGGAGNGGRSTSTGGSGAGGDAGAPATDAGSDATSGASTCKNPLFVTSAPNGGYSDSGYYIHNNMWNSSAGLGPETLSACSYHDWYVVSNQTNNAGAVKTYPNVHIDYADVLLSSYKAITSTFAETSPHVGIYDVAYDIWTNGVATSGSTEIMIWTENYKQVPAGNRAMTVTFGGRPYDVWKTANNHYIAFVPSTPFTSGTVDLLEIFKWTMSQGWLASDSTLGQIDFGVEIVETGGGEATFAFTDFAITTK
jgi:hypothetical protein